MTLNTMMGNFEKTPELPLTQYLWSENTFAHNTFSASPLKEIEKPQGLRQNILAKYAMPSKVKIEVQNNNDNGDMESMISRNRRFKSNATKSVNKKQSNVKDKRYKP